MEGLFLTSRQLGRQGSLTRAAQHVVIVPQRSRRKRFAGRRTGKHLAYEAEPNHAVKIINGLADEAAKTSSVTS